MIEKSVIERLPKEEKYFHISVHYSKVNTVQFSEELY